MKRSEMREMLENRGIRLTRSLGQSFLHDANQLQRIVEAAELKTQDKVLEIGPGLGPLTERLLANSGHVLAIEKDRRLLAVFRERLREPTNPELLEAHAFAFLKSQPADGTHWKLVA